MVINKRVLLGAAGVVILGIIYGALWLNGLVYQKSTSGKATAYLTIIAPVNIPTFDSSAAYATPTATIDPAIGDLQGIAIGSYVQITGTSDLGLNIRENPGKDGLKIFIASESEVLQVIEGPVMKDEIIWWKLTTPYDQTRQGWAAADYLTLIQK